MAVAPDAAALSVASLNLAKEQDASRILADLKSAPAVSDASVLLFQEATHSEKAQTGVAGEVALALHRNIAFSPEAPGVYDRGLAILSRYPIRGSHVRVLKPFSLRFHSRARFALAAVIDTPAGPLRVWNVHLDTRINAQQRFEQLGPVIAEAATLPEPKIIAGDFNSNDFYWIGNLFPVPWVQPQAEPLRRFMSSQGFNAPLQDGRATFEHLGMHLDWIFEKGLAARRAAVHQMPFSDHRALVVDFAR